MGNNVNITNNNIITELAFEINKKFWEEFTIPACLQMVRCFLLLFVVRLESICEERVSFNFGCLNCLC